MPEREMIFLATTKPANIWSSKVTTRRQPRAPPEGWSRTGAAPSLGREPENQTRIGLTAEVGGYARLDRRPHGRGHAIQINMNLTTASPSAGATDPRYPKDTT